MRVCGMSTVAITGAGVVTAVAQSPAALHRALCDGTDAMTRLTDFEATGIACNLGAKIDLATLQHDGDNRPIVGVDRIGQITIAAVRRALAAADAGASVAQFGLVLGTMFSGAHTIAEFDRRAETQGPQFASPLDFANTVLNAAAGQAAIRLSLHGPNVTLAGGHASGLQALGYAADLIRADRAAMLIAGGVEELSLESYLGFGRAGLMCGTNGRPGHVPIPFDTRRTGCALGEAAAFVTLESSTSARERCARTLATIDGHASAMDPDALVRGCCGRTVIADVIAEALRRADVEVAHVDAISAAANGSFEADAEEAAALNAAFAGRRLPP